jgi:hypothetical protein
MMYDVPCNVSSMCANMRDLMRDLALSRVDQNLLAVPWRAFQDTAAKTAPAELVSLIEFAAGRGRGFHVIPSAAMSAFSSVLSNVAQEAHGVMMIAGDCPIFHDDGRWGGRDTIAQLEQNRSESAMEHVMCSFDLPRISPEKQCVAIPVDLHLLAQGFANCASASGFVTKSATISPCVLSAFAVVDVLCIRQQLQAAEHELSLAPAVPLTSSLQFGPNELQVLRDAISEEGFARQHVSLVSLCELLCGCQFDTLFFLEVRFLVLELLQTNQEQEHSCSCRECWGLAAVKAFAQQHAVDENSFQQTRQDMLQWLQAMHLPHFALFFMSPAETQGGVVHVPGSNLSCLPSLQLQSEEVQKLSSWAPTIALGAWECFHLLDAHAAAGKEPPAELKDRLAALLADPVSKVPGLKRLKRKFRAMLEK